MPRLCLLLPLGRLQPPGMRTELSKEQGSGGSGHQGDPRRYPPEKHRAGAVCGAVWGLRACLSWAARNVKLEDRVAGRLTFPRHCARIDHQVRQEAQRFISESPLSWRKLCILALLSRIAGNFLHMTPNLAKAVYFFSSQLMSNMEVGHRVVFFRPTLFQRKNKCVWEIDLSVY